MQIFYHKEILFVKSFFKINFCVFATKSRLWYNTTSVLRNGDLQTGK